MPLGLSYFRSSFIQRLIEYHWNGPLVRYYSVVSGFYLASFGLILISIISMQQMSQYPYNCLVFRMILMSLNFIILCISLLTFEIKSFLEDKVGYIKSFWNQNDICLFFMSIAVLVQEFYIFYAHRSTLDDDYGLTLSMDEIAVQEAS